MGASVVLWEQKYVIAMNPEEKNKTKTKFHGNPSSSDVNITVEL